jgi:hypothetical protein
VCRIGLLIALFASFIFHSCRENLHTSDGLDSLVYDAYTDDENSLSIRFEETLGIISRQKLLLKAIVTNNSDHALKISPAQWELQTHEGNRSLPVSFRSKYEKLGAKETDTIFISYEPVNSRRLYQHTGARGDLDLKYELKIRTDDEHPAIAQTITLEADEESYNKSIATNGLDATTTLFTLSGLSANEVQPHFTNINATSDRPIVSENGNEVLSQGCWIKFSVLHKNDTLHVIFRLVNQSSSAVDINIRNIKLLGANGNLILPRSVDSNSIKIQRGDRTSFEARYPIPIQNSFSLDMNGFTFDGDSTRQVYGARVNFTSYKAEQIP